MGFFFNNNKRRPECEGRACFRKVEQIGLPGHFLIMPPSRACSSSLTSQHASVSHVVHQEASVNLSEARRSSFITIYWPLYTF